MSYTSELDTAITAVRAAARVCQAVQRQLVDAKTIQKRDNSPVTVADFASQAVVCAHLQTAFPGDPVVGEEDASDLRDTGGSTARSVVTEYVRGQLGASTHESDVLAFIDRGGSNGHAQGSAQRFWTLDPIDGTKGFLRGEQYAVALALIENGRVVLGVLACPNLPHACGIGTLMAAGVDHGTREMSLESSDKVGQLVGTCEAIPVSTARFCESVESGHSDHDHAARIAKLLGITRGPLRMDSQAKYAAVARGDAQIYLRLPTRADYREKIWDHAAGLIVVQEAGGTITDVTGKPLDFTRGRELTFNCGVVATAGGIHATVLAAVAQVL